MGGMAWMREKGKGEGWRRRWKGERVTNQGGHSLKIGFSSMKVFQRKKCISHGIALIDPL